MAGVALAEGGRAGTASGGVESAPFGTHVGKGEPALGSSVLAARIVAFGVVVLENVLLIDKGAVAVVPVSEDDEEVCRSSV